MVRLNRMFAVYGPVSGNQRDIVFGRHINITIDKICLIYNKQKSIYIIMTEPIKTPPFGAYYQCHKNPLSTYSCIDSFRKYYPDVDIVLVSDNGYDYSEVAKQYNCTYIHCDKNLVYIHRQMNDGTHITHALSLMDRIVDALSHIKEDYFMWLEDDVIINQQVCDTLSHDLNGYCPHMYFDDVLNELHAKYPFIDPKGDYRWSGHGGSIFNKHSLLSVFSNKDVVMDVLTNWHTYRLLADELPQDYFFSLLFHLNKKTIGPLKGHFDGINNIRNYAIHVQHQFKRYYGQDLPEHLAHLVKK